MRMNSLFNENNYLSGLNERQKEAVLHTEGPLLVFAGAGAGKTKTVTHRIMHLIKNGVEPKNILAITFTNKAAKEMRDRVMTAIENDPGLKTISPAEKPFLSTFHSLGVHIIKENARMIGLTRHFSIFDKSDSLKTVRDIIKDMGLDIKLYEPGKILGIISREKSNLLEAEEYRETLQGENFTGWHGLVAQVWLQYEKKLAEEKALDFDDLLLKTYKILKNHPDILEKYQNTWKYIHVDEYQDTNKVQYMTVKLLAEKNKNLCVVGDIDQNIYSWRGADIKNIMNFEKDYPQAKIVLLEQNYRSTQTILSVANEIIKKIPTGSKKIFSPRTKREKKSQFSALTMKTKRPSTSPTRPKN